MYKSKAQKSANLPIARVLTKTGKKEGESLPNTADS
jgi:hypothetical protein